MNDLSRYFQPRDAQSLAHPFLKHVDQAQGKEAVQLQIERPRIPLGYLPAKLRLVFSKNGNGFQPEADLEEDWDVSLSDGLLDRHVRAASIDEETTRFALSLGDDLEKAEIKFGDGVLNGVLIHDLDKSPFADHPLVKPILQHVYRSEFDVSLHSHRECSEMIDAAIRRRALNLTEKLGYNLPEAEEILAGAVARYVDERFSVSSRKAMGLA